MNASCINNYIDWKTIKKNKIVHMCSYLQKDFRIFIEWRQYQTQI